MAGTVQHRKMVDIDVSETSGVDHPAHLVEGWIVCKSATDQHVEALFGPLNTRKGTDVPTTDTKEPTEKASGPTVEELQKQVADLKEKLALATKAPAGKATPFGKSADEEREEMLKALPESIREELAKAAQAQEDLRKQADADREELRKERATRLDKEAVLEFQGLYKSVAVDASVVAPALRQVAEINPELAKSITTALAAADGQLQTAGLFKEVGSTEKAAGGSAMEKINAKAEELQKSETGLTAAAAFAKAVQADPELYNEYLNEKAGN